MTPIRNRRGDAGMTVVEIMVGAGVLAVLLSLALALLMVANNNYATEVTAVGLDQHARWTIDRITEDVRGSVASTRTLTQVGADVTLSFRRNAGYFGGAVQLGNTITWQTEMFPGEIDNGVDDNANGLVDERQIVRNENGPRAVIATYVDEGGLQLTDLGQALQISLSLRNFDASGLVHQEQATALVQFRNP